MIKINTLNHSIHAFASSFLLNDLRLVI